jgi:hypothetical protein
LYPLKSKIKAGKNDIMEKNRGYNEKGILVAFHYKSIQGMPEMFLSAYEI